MTQLFQVCDEKLKIIIIDSINFALLDFGTFLEIKEKYQVLLSPGQIKFYEISLRIRDQQQNYIFLRSKPGDNKDQILIILSGVYALTSTYSISLYQIYQMLKPTRFWIIIIMQKNSWTPREDKALLEIVQERKITQWALVARIIEQDYGISGRTGKQCRQRWFNQLNPTLDTESFTKEEEDILFAEQSRIGNKWAKICCIFPNRSDNFVKNHFYSTFRKAYRKVNRELLTLRGREYKLIKNIVINRVLLCAQQKFQQKSEINQKIIELAIQIKNRLLPFARIKKIEKDQEEELFKLVELINIFKSSEANITRKKVNKKRKSVYMNEPVPGEQIFQKNTSKRRMYSDSSDEDMDDSSFAIVRKQVHSKVEYPIIDPLAKTAGNPQSNASFSGAKITQATNSDQPTSNTSELFQQEKSNAPPKTNYQSIFLGYVPVYINTESCTHFFANGIPLQSHQLHGLFSNNMMPPMMPPPINMLNQQQTHFPEVKAETGLQ